MENFTRSDLAYENPAARRAEQGYREERVGPHTVARLEIRDDESGKRFGKEPGAYVTVLCEKMWLMSEDDGALLVRLVADELRKLCFAVCGKRVDRNFRVLVAGLGNSEITPDAIGPNCVRQLNVTRHLRSVDGGLYDTVGRCEISAVSPGVLGQTGIETVELIRGAAENARPDVVVAIDALAARSCERLAATVQISDAGIRPGSGIGNARKAICRETVGCPVIAVGVPTVVDSSTLVWDALDRAGIRSVEGELRRVLENGRRFFVSPKESDVITERVSRLLADAVDTAFTVV